MKKIREFLTQKPLLALGLAIIIGLLLGWLIFGGDRSLESKVETAVAENHDHEEGTIWTCSMHPQIRETKPGKCPICGMTLIPLQKDSGNDDIPESAVVLTASAMKIAEVETSVIEERVPYKLVILPGMVKPDERRIHELTAHFPGRIEKLNVNFTGQKVRKGEVLATIFSPDLVTAQKELFESLKYKESNPQFYKAARNKFKLWLFTEEQIDGIIEAGEVQFYFDILSPGSGTVTKRNVALGDHVMEGMSMFQIIDLTHVWVEFDAYESDIPWIRVGSKVDISIKSVPGRIFKSRVTFIDPVLNLQTRTTVVRAELDNRYDLLRPGMFAQGKIQSRLASKKEAILVPKSAILWTGKRSVVYVKEDHGDTFAFHYREITLGEDAGDFYVVVDGLQPGEEVVTNGAFKIDAAAQLKGERSMMNPEGGKVSTGHNHGGGAPSGGSDDAASRPAKEHTKEMKISTEAKNALRPLYEQYNAMKEALTKDDMKGAQKASEILVQQLDKVNMSLFTDEAHIAWMDFSKKIKDAIEHVPHFDEIGKVRSAFEKLSGVMINMANVFKPLNKEAYVMHCPMAFDNKGANWLSFAKEVKNPYFGAAMPTCGELKETIK